MSEAKTNGDVPCWEALQSKQRRVEMLNFAFDAVVHARLWLLRGVDRDMRQDTLNYLQALTEQEEAK